MTDNIRNMTLAHEREQEIIGSLRTKNDQLVKALQAIEHHRNNFNDQLSALQENQSAVEAKLAAAKDQFYEKQSVFRARRGEQKEIQLNFAADRIQKFAALIEKKEDKYINLAQLARVILTLLGQDAGSEDKEVGVALFKDVPQLQLKMNTQIPNQVSDEILSA